MRRIMGSLVVGVILGACGGGTTPSAVPSSVTPSPSEAARVYRYTLPWPEAEMESKWLYADLAWDGEARIDHGNEYTDSARTQDGDLFAFGLET